MNRKLRNHLTYYWWVYLISTLLVVTLWVSVFNKLAEPKANEQLNITYIGSAFDNVRLQSDLYGVTDALTEQKIKRISVENAIADGEYELNTALRARTNDMCDFLIVESKVIDEYQVDLASYFAEVDSAALTKYFGDVEQITKEGKTYGLKLKPNCKIYDYYSGKGDLTLFFTKNSVNMSDLNGGNVNQDAALRVIVYLTEENDV